jgi:peptidoglycan/LPS O-acetylase OafA/YrhL
MHAKVQVPSEAVGRTAYRPDIDGLRAIAVLSVLAFHYGAPLPPEWRLSGGFTGVDVFFVISGFLITSKLNDDIRAGTFSVLSFYDRRIRRILPALIVMLAATLLAGRFLLMPGDYKSLADSTATAAFGISNFYFLFNTGYFDQAAELLPLLHTWSLAVEEQFYVVWPILLFIAAKNRHRIAIATILASVLFLGFAASLIWFVANPKAAFFMAVPRAWELSIGAMLVFLSPLPRPLGEVATVAGLALVGAGFLMVTATSFPGPAALYPCAGAALVIWPRRGDSAAGRLLGYLRPIGLISYSLYLWHWPVWVFYRIYINGSVPRFREALALAVVSIAAATLSYFVVEKPVRRTRPLPAKTIQAGLFACGLIFIGSMYVASKDGMPSRISPNVYAMRSREVMWDWKCPREITLSNRTYCVLGAPWETSRKGILWGDSHAQHLAPLLDLIARERGMSVILEGGCPAALGKHVHRRWPENPSYQRDCSDIRLALRNILASERVEFVILASAWHTLATDDLYADDGRTGNKIDFVRSGLADTIADIASPSRKVTVITNMTGPAVNLSECVIANSSGLLRRPCPASQMRIDSKSIRAMFAPTNDALDSLAANIIRPVDRMCDDADCLSIVNGEFLWMDYSHIRRNLSIQTDADLAVRLSLGSAFP